MTMMRKINKREKPGGPQGNFHASFGRSAAIYGYSQADAVTSECSTRISPSTIALKVYTSVAKGLKLLEREGEREELFALADSE